MRAMLLDAPRRPRGVALHSGAMFRRFPSNRTVALLAGLLAACGDRAPTEPSGVPGVYLAGVVRDPDGTVVPLITVVWEAWPAPDSVQQGAVSDYSVRWFTRTDSTGRFAAHVGYYSVGLLDSLELGVGADGCWGLAPLTIRNQAVTVRPSAPDTVLNSELALSRTAPRARLAVGPACAVMVEPPPFQEEDRFGLWIDEISDSIRGRWRINYQGSRGDDYGHFSGLHDGSAVTLELRHDSPWDAGPPWGTCTGYTLELTVEAGDTLGTGTYRSDGCPTVPTTLRFIEGEWLNWPFP
jgi:hypothetical protein